MEIILKATNIHKSFGHLKVLEGIDFEINKEEIVAIVGKSGAGKSTLLHILGTLDHPDEGNVIIKGVNPFDYNNKSLAQFRNQSLGFIFQFHHLLNEFTALENVMIPTYVHTEQKDQKERAEYLLEIMGIIERKDHKPAQLSGGEQQRVAIARALIQEPDIIYADEPSGNLDVATSEEIHDLFLRLREELHQTFVIVTHNMDLARMSDRIVNMKGGKLA